MPPLVDSNSRKSQCEVHPNAKLILVLAAGPVLAAEPDLAEIVVTAPYASTLSRDRVPARSQTATAEDIQRLQPLALGDLLSQAFGSVNINDAQNNPLQPDVNFRGFTASPLLGLPQGLTVYANGVRMNETFGDTVNWDLLPVSSIRSVQLLAGPNPVFGLNTLGGTLSLQLKDGFNFDGTEAEIQGGSFGRRSATLQYGGNNGSWGAYADIDYFAEDGWRDDSASDALRVYGVLSHRGDPGNVDLSVAHAESTLRGNGAVPVELLAVDRSQVFTHPDITENNLTQFALQASTAEGNPLRFSGNAFIRDLDTNTFNGDASIFKPCDVGGNDLLVEADFNDLNGDGACSADTDDNVRLVHDPEGEPIYAELHGQELNAINNIGRRRQKSYGASLQLAHELPVGADRRNNFLFGSAYIHGKSGFAAVTEVAQLLDDRSTTRTGIYADEYRTQVDSGVTTWSLYAADTLDLTKRLSLTVTGRYDQTTITLADRSGQSPELDGHHGYGRFNPATGLTFRIKPDLLMYASLSQSSRTPSAVELACADEHAPCSLPNAFLADPPLDEVVARNAEIGLSGTSHTVHWSIDAFQTSNRNDIQFQATGGAQGNVGFFNNVGDTRRRGIELELSQRLDRLEWKFNYSLIDATYQDSFVVNSPNHPLFGDDAADYSGADLIAGEGQLRVPAGSTIPGTPRHIANLGIDYNVTARLRLGTAVEWRSGVYLRGDEVNVLGLTDAYAVVNLHGSLRLNDHVNLFGRIENLFNNAYESFGLLGEPQEVFPAYSNPRFYGPGPPIGAWLGVRVTL
jgi:iron complex outermembrane recepter protein